MDKIDLKILQLVVNGDVYWSRREGGSEPYQIYGKRIHELVKMGYVYEFQNKSCCLRDYGITDKGLEVLRNER